MKKTARTGLFKVIPGAQGADIMNRALNDNPFSSYLNLDFYALEPSDFSKVSNPLDSITLWQWYALK